MYQVEITTAALRELSRIHGTDRQRLDEAIESLGRDPRPVGVKKLSGKPDLYRIRIGDYRVLYEINDARLVVVVVKIGNRKDIYRSSPMNRYTLVELSAYASEILGRVAAGERVVLGDGNVEVALVSVDDLQFLESTDDTLDEQHAAEARRIRSDPKDGQTVPFRRESESPVTT